MPPKVMHCGPKCRSRKHAYELNVAISKGSLHEIQSFSALCYNGAQVNDIHGCSALHVATSCGKLEVIEWLLEERNGDITLKDVESGWTALHRAMFYGQLAAARLLIQYKSDLHTRDHEGLGPLDIAMKDRRLVTSVPPPVYQLQDRHEVYTWGDNSNFTLGHMSEQKRSVPEVVDELRKQNVTIKQVLMCKYHTVFLTDTGRVYTCGHGLGGRLGHATEETCLVPRLVESLTSEVCVQVAGARDHTVFLTDSGAVFTCGMNEHHQLGQQPAPDKSPLPRSLNNKGMKGKAIKGICAGRFHTILYTKDSVYTCGLNAGQMGHPKPKGDRKVSQLRQVSVLNVKDVSIISVKCSDAATVVLTQAGEIYVLHEYQCRIISSNRTDLLYLSVVGGCLDHTDSQILRENGGKELIISYLNQSGKVFLWRDRSTSFKRAHWMIHRLLYVTDFVLTEAGLAVVTEEGEVFVGYLSNKPPPVRENAHSTKESVKGTFGQMSLMDLLMQEEIEEVQVRRISNVHRATYITADKKGYNYTTVQSLPNCNLTDVPTVSRAAICEDFERLLEESDEYDLIHDLILQVHDQVWPVHTFILVNRCANFLSLLSKGGDQKHNEMEIPVIDLEDIHPQIIDQLLMYIYTDTCDLLKVGSKFDLAEHHNVQQGQTVTRPSNDGVFQMDFEESIETISNNKRESAFQVNKKKKGKHVKDEGSVLDNNYNQRNPVKLLQDVAKKWAVKGLSKKLDCVKYQNCMIHSTNKKIPQTNLQFYRDKLRDNKWELYDVTIKSEDGIEFQCHKCVLVARLEYFHSMLASGWMETSSCEALTLPIPGDILEILLDFLYTDNSTVVQNSQNVELLCNILVVADQMLVVRLKEMCEAAIATLLTLRNVGEVLEFASTYNADQLRTTCQQYIVINLPALLEARGLEVLSDCVMEDLIKYYRQSIENMSRRQITPWDEFPDKDYLETLAAEDIDLSTPAGFTPEPRKSKAKKKRNRTKSSSEDQQKKTEKLGGLKLEIPRITERQLSVCSDTSVKSDEDVQESTEAINVNVNTNHTIIPMAISPSFSGPWGHVTSPASPSVPMETTTVNNTSSPSLRDIMDQEKTDKRSSKNTGGHKSGKFSWKEEKKKKQQQQQQQKDNIRNNNNNNNNSNNNSVRESTYSQSQDNHKDQSQDEPGSLNPWGSFNKVVQSFRNLMMEEEKPKTNIPSRGSGDKNRVEPSSKSSKQGASNKTSIMSWGLPKSGISIPRSAPSLSGAGSVSPRSPDNPWVSGSAQSPTSPSFSFSEIIKDEQKKTDVLVKNIKKPLSLIQIEEQAIQDLLKHYNAAANQDERITVERVPQEAAIPLWKRERLTST